MKAKHYRRILVRATNWVGDAVMSLPALRALREQYPDAKISILARPWVADLYARESFCDEMIPYEAPKGWGGLATKWGIARRLGDHRFDCAVLLQNAFEAAAVAWAARIPERIGYNRDGRRLLLTNAVAVPKPGEIPKHQRFYYLELLKRAGLIETYSPDAEVRLTGTATAAEQGRQLFAERGLSGRVIGVSPGAAYGNAKRWLPERFVEAASRLASELDAAVAIFGSKPEAELGGQIAASLTTEGITAQNFAGATSLKEFIEMAAACELFLTNDSGSMHIASALGVPTVVIFGPTDEFATGPAGRRNVIVREPVDCAPCHNRECPIDHRCMTRVDAQRVAEAALQLLK
jgi:heptosyltransferase II